MPPRRDAGRRANARVGQNRGRGRNNRVNDGVSHRGERPEDRTDRHEAGVQQPGNQNPLGPFMAEFVATLEARIPLAQPPRADPVSRAMEVARGFRRFNPPEFDGLTSDPLTAHRWLAETRKLFNLLAITEDTLRVHLVACQLTGEADEWWQSVLEERKDARRAMRVANCIDEPDVEDITWAEFEAKFEDSYFPSSYRYQLRDQFEKLEQGTMTVSEYAIKFQSLSRFAPEQVRSEDRKCQRFVRGLNPSIRRFVLSGRCERFNDAVELARILESDEARQSSIEKPEASLPNPTMSVIPGSSDSQDRKRTRNSFQLPYNYSVSRTPISASVGVSQSRPADACHRCGQQGHYRAQCPKPKALPKPRVPNSGICFGCGEFGHFEKSCPRKSESHQPRNYQPQPYFYHTTTVQRSQGERGASSYVPLQSAPSQYYQAVAAVPPPLYLTFQAPGTSTSRGTSFYPTLLLRLFELAVFISCL